MRNLVQKTAKPSILSHFVCNQPNAIQRHCNADFLELTHSKKNRKPKQYEAGKHSLSRPNRRSLFRSEVVKKETETSAKKRRPMNHPCLLALNAYNAVSADFFLKKGLRRKQENHTALLYRSLCSLRLETLPSLSPMFGRVVTQGKDGRGGRQGITATEKEEIRKEKEAGMNKTHKDKHLKHPGNVFSVGEIKREQTQTCILMQEKKGKTLGKYLFFFISFSATKTDFIPMTYDDCLNFPLSIATKAHHVTIEAKTPTRRRGKKKRKSWYLFWPHSLDSLSRSLFWWWYKLLSYLWDTQNIR